MINKNITTKKNIDEHKIVLIHSFLIKRSYVLVFDMFVFTNINFMRKIERKLPKKKKEIRLIEFYLVSPFYDDPQQWVRSEVRNKRVKASYWLTGEINSYRM